MASTPQKVLIDCDPGLDDALALFMALKAHRQGIWDIKAITTVVGNTSVDNACNNVLRVLEVADTKVEVYRGCSSGLVCTFQRPKEKLPFFGHDGFGDVNYPLPKSSVLLKRHTHAVDHMIALTQVYQGDIELFAMGPLTNIAAAIRKDESFTKRLKAMYIMGGNSKGRGNITPTAEFNFYCDPEAAYVVLNNIQCPLTIVPWELCTDIATLPLTYRKLVLGDIDSKEARFMNRIEYNHITAARPIRNTYQTEGYRAPDAVLTAIGLWPEIVTRSERCYATVELSGKYSRGQMVVDHVNHYRKKKNVEIVQDLDVDRLKSMLVWALGGKVTEEVRKPPKEEEREKKKQEVFRVECIVKLSDDAKVNITSSPPLPAIEN